MEIKRKEKAEGPQELTPGNRIILRKKGADNGGVKSRVGSAAPEMPGFRAGEGVLRTSQLQLSQMMDLARIVYWEVDPSTDTFTFNGPFSTLYGITAEREGGYVITREEYGRRFVHPDDIGIFRQAGEKCLAHSEGDFFHDFEHRIVRRDGEVRHVITRIRFIRDSEGRALGYYGATQDITDRKIAEEELARERRLKEIELQRGRALERSREELRNLCEHLQRVREREQTRIAREVHDEVGQFLTALKIDLTCVSQDLVKNQGSLREQLEDMTKKIDDAVQSVRRICLELRPSILEDFGLPAAIEWHLEGLAKRTGIQFKARIEPAFPNVNKKLALVLFRIFQDAVTNTIRYAEASMVRVSLQNVEDNVVLKVRDNGKGISKKDLLSPGSIGIIGMRERVRFWNGNLAFYGRRDRGTTMIVSIPLIADEGESKDLSINFLPGRRRKPSRDCYGAET